MIILEQLGDLPSHRFWSWSLPLRAAARSHLQFGNFAHLTDDSRDHASLNKDSVVVVGSLGVLLGGIYSARFHFFSLCCLIVPCVYPSDAM